MSDPQESPPPDSPPEQPQQQQQQQQQAPELRLDKQPPRPAPTWAYTWREYHPNARLYYLRDHLQANQMLALLKHGPLGFDLEWKPNWAKGPENPVSLVQFANDEYILLIQLSAMQEFPMRLAAVLANPLYIKVGVGIQGDAEKISKECSLSLHNCVDLSLLARTVDDRWQGKYASPLGLARLVETYEYRILVKGKLPRSDWSRPLRENMQEYAANDAHAGYVLYERLAQMIPALPYTSDPDWYSFDCVYGECRSFNGTPWRPFNPKYHPGPVPPPKLPKERKDNNNNNDASSTTQTGESVPDTPPPPPAPMTTITSQTIPSLPPQQQHFRPRHSPGPKAGNGNTSSDRTRGFHSPSRAGRFSLATQPMVYPGTSSSGSSSSPGPSPHQAQRPPNANSNSNRSFSNSRGPQSQSYPKSGGPQQQQQAPGVGGGGTPRGNGNPTSPSRRARRPKAANPANPLT